jgi:hypothetical protein
MSASVREENSEKIEPPVMIYNAQVQALDSGDTSMYLYSGTLAGVAGHMPMAEDYRGRQGIVPARGIFKACHYILGGDHPRTFLFRPTLVNMHGFGVRGLILAPGDDQLISEVATNLSQVGHERQQPREAELIIFGRQMAEAVKAELMGRPADTARHLAALFDHVLDPPADSYQPLMTNPALVDA